MIQYTKPLTPHYKYDNTIRCKGGLYIKAIMTGLTGLYSVLRYQSVMMTKSIGSAKLEGNESINGIDE